MLSVVLLQPGLQLCSKWKYFSLVKKKSSLSLTQFHNHFKLAEANNTIKKISFTLSPTSVLHLHKISVRIWTTPQWTRPGNWSKLKMSLAPETFVFPSQISSPGLFSSQLHQQLFQHKGDGWVTWGSGWAAVVEEKGWDCFTTDFCSQEWHWARATGLRLAPV